MKKLLLISSFTFLFLTSFTLFVYFHNDGLRSWTKEFDYEINEIVEGKGFRLVKQEDINPNDVSWNFKTKFRRFIYNFNCDNGLKLVFQHTHTDAYLICYMRSAGDHVKAFYVECYGIDKTTLDYFKSKIAKDFVGYEVDWIENN